VRERITSKGLQLRLALEGDHDSAGSLAVDGRGRRRRGGDKCASSPLDREEIGGHRAGSIDIEAGVAEGAPGVYTAAEQEARGEPRVESDVEEVVDELLIPEVRGLRHVGADLPEFRRRDVGQATDRIPTAAGQPRITWRRDAERIEVGGGHQDVVGSEEVTVPVAVIAGGHR